MSKMEIDEKIEVLIASNNNSNDEILNDSVNFTSSFTYDDAKNAFMKIIFLHTSSLDAQQVFRNVNGEFAENDLVSIVFF